MQRSKIRAADIVGDPIQWNRINAEKCLAYLRGIGVEIDDATGDSWLDTQGVHRLLQRMQASEYTFGEVECKCGELSGVTVHRRGRRARMKRVTRVDVDYFCELCKTFIGAAWRLLYVVRADGSEEDHRKGPDRCVPFAWRDMVEDSR